MKRTAILLMIARFIVIIGMFSQLETVKGHDSSDYNEGADENDHAHDGEYVEIVAPQIELPMDEKELEYGETWSVKCMSQKPIVWKPFDAEYEWDPPNINIAIYSTSDAETPYGAELTIKNASALMVGRYYCVHSVREDEEPDELIAENGASSIYVYVNDPHQLIVPLPIKNYFFNKEQFVICKPSHPDVVVELCIETSINCITTSDPTRGFRFHEIRSINNIYCKANGLNYNANSEHPRGDVENRLNKPTIISETGDLVPLGKTVNLTCGTVAYGFATDISWKILPNYQPAEIDKTISVREQSSVYSYGLMSYFHTRELIIQNAILQHTRTYRCELTLHKKYTSFRNFKLRVRQSPDDFVILSTHHNRTTIHCRANRNGEKLPIDIIIQYKSYPRIISYQWSKGSVGEIYKKNVTGYRQKMNENYIMLTIPQPKMYNTDNYTVEVHAGTAKATFTMRVLVYEKPSLEMGHQITEKGNIAYFYCWIHAYPLPEVRFMFQRCKEVTWKNCSNVNITEAAWHLETRIVYTQYHYITRVLYEVIADEPGIVYCKANNSEGQAMSQAYLMIENVSDFMSLEILQPEGLITVGDNVTIICSTISIQDTTTEIKLEHNGKEDLGSVIQNDAMAHRVQFILSNVDLNDSGDILCNATYTNTEILMVTKLVHIEVKEAISPRLRSGEITQTIIVDAMDHIILECDVIGAPEPKITWLKNAAFFAYNMTNTKNTSSITIEYANPTDSGLYECVAENKIGNITLTRIVVIRNSKSNQPILYGTIALLILLLIAFVLISFFFYKKMKQLSGLQNLADSNFGCYNPDIALNEQTDLLPYNPQYEFPKERLKLLTQLGMGAFGVVMKATATGIKIPEETTTVAVKVVKNKHDDDSMRALLSELKIMVHLGRHLNVVNLLGAVTQNISNHELMVIVEYCAYGNLQDYLQKHRARFMDQISKQTDEIIRSGKSVGDYQYNVHGLKYVSLSFSTNNINHPAPHQQPAAGGCPGRRRTYENKNITTEEHEDHNTSAHNPLSRNLNEPKELSSHPNDHPETPLRSINTTDLIIWAAQIASGMEYLASRNVMHGDLAARNILLCDENVVKICDFGLASTIYRRNVYKKKGKALLPFKWLAIECIADNVFNTKSDVWAYGIVLWELFSLGRTPYPGLEGNLELYEMLKEGYRMEKPTYANQDIYDVMLNCWADDPHSRPTFQELRCRFNAMIPEEMLERLLKLNEPYVEMNAENTKTNATSSPFSLDIDYVNVIKSHTSSDDNQGKLEHDLGPQMTDREAITASNDDDVVEQIGSSLETGDPCSSQKGEPHYMKMNKVREVLITGVSMEDTLSGSSKMQENSNAVFVSSSSNVVHNSCYIEMIQLNQKR